MPPRVHLECIVEGHGERTAVPALVHRWLKLKQPRDSQRYAWTLDTVVTHNCALIKNAHNPTRKIGVECYVNTALAKGAHGVLVVVDADDDRPLELGASLRKRARQVARDVPVGIVVANREYEAWFVADLWSFRRRGVLSHEHRLEPLVAPEARRDAKGLVGVLLGRGYEESSDQLALTSQLSFNRGSRRRSPSFKHLAKELWRFTREARRYALTRP